MENTQGDPGTQNGSGENEGQNQGQPTKVEVDAAELADLKKKAEVSSQNYERLKKIESEKKELEAKLTGSNSTLDPAALKKDIEERVNLRMSGHSPEELEEIEAYAKGRGVSLSEAAKSPFVMKAVEAIRAEKKSTDNTPPPSSRIKVFNGKPVSQIFKEGTSEEKQAAFEARVRGGAKGNE